MPTAVVQPAPVDLAWGGLGWAMELLEGIGAEQGSQGAGDAQTGTSPERPWQLRQLQVSRLPVDVEL